MIELHDEGACQSNDLHVLALAQVSGARLLYSNDLSLHQDFGNRDLIRPRGRIYSTHAGGQIQASHKSLLQRRDRCVTEHRCSILFHCNSTFHSRLRLPFEPPPSAVISNRLASEYATLPILSHHRRSVSTANTAVS